MIPGSGLGTPAAGVLRLRPPPAVFLVNFPGRFAVFFALGIVLVAGCIGAVFYQVTNDLLDRIEEINDQRGGE